MPAPNPTQIVARNACRWIILLVALLIPALVRAQSATDKDAKPTLKYVPNEVIVKFKPQASAKLQDIVSSSEAKQGASLSASLKNIHQHYNATKLERVAKDFAKKQARLEQLAKADVKTLSGDDKHLAQRLQRAPRNAKVPALDQYYKVTFGPNPARDIQEIIAAYKADPDVESAEPNTIYSINATPNDPSYNSQWPLNNTGQAYPYNGAYGLPPGTVDADIDAPEAWDIQSGSDATIVAVIDTGVDYNHRDLAANIWVNQAEASGTTGVDDDGNGVIDDVRGYDFCSYNNTRDANPIDDHGHGTHCAGIIAAVGNNGTDVCGVSWRSKIMCIKAMSSSGEGSLVDLAEAIRYASDKGADIISMSWGGPGVDYLESAIGYAASHGVMLVAAAGNDDSDTLFYPARYYQVLGVGATDSKDTKASFSNHSCWVELAAPGVDILSLRAAGTAHGTVQDNYLTVMSGTSMACPCAAGVAALVLAQHPAFTPDDVRDILKMTSDPVQTTEYIGQGRVNAYRAVNIASPTIKAFLDMNGQMAEQTKIKESIDIHGTAAGAQFARYELYSGRGDFPTSWSLLATSLTAVENGVLMSGLDTQRLGEGLSTIRLVVTDTQGRSLEERRFVVVSNFQMLGPMNNDVLKPDGVIPLRLHTPAGNQILSIEYGSGYDPAQWSTAGISLDANPNDDIIGSWNTSALQGNGFYTLRYTVATPYNTEVEFVRSIYFDQRLKAGWPQYVNRVDTSERPEIYVTPADLDGDGYMELVAVEPGSYLGTKNPFLRVYNYDGTLRWSMELNRYPMSQGEYCAPYNSVPVIGDVDHDGHQEIFVDVGRRRSPVEVYPMYAFRHDGTALSGWPVDLPFGDSEKALADVNRDGYLELICKSRMGGDQMVNGNIVNMNHLYVLNRFGTVMQDISIPNLEAASSIRVAPVVGNFDQDDQLEIAVTYGVHDGDGHTATTSAAVYNLDGTLVPGWPTVIDSYIIHAMFAADLDRNGRDELVTMNGTNMEGGQVGGVYAFDGAGNVLPGWPVLGDKIHWDSYFSSSLAAADINRDGNVDICVARGSLLYMYDLSGHLLPGWPQDLDPWCQIYGPPIIGDINADGNVDVVVKAGSIQPKVPTDDTSNGGIFAFNGDGSVIDLCAESALYPIFTELWYYGRVSMADIDCDGKIELIATSMDNTSFFDPTGKKGHDSIYVYDLDAPYRPENVDWWTWQNGSAGGGRYQYPPTLPSTVWVDFFYSGFESGSIAAPFNTLLEGVTGVHTAGTIMLKPGSSPTPIRITKPTKIKAATTPVRLGGS